MKTDLYKLDAEEQAIENEIHKYVSVSDDRKKVLQALATDKSEKRKNITVRMDIDDLSLLKDRAKKEGMPYQTLLSSMVHKFVTNQLLDKDSIMRSIELLQNKKAHK